MNISIKVKKMSNGIAESDKQVAVLIDFENVGLNSIQWLFDQLSDIGRVIVKRAYADWSHAGRSRDKLLQLGIEPIHLFHNTQSGKNSSDIRLAIDAVELLYQAPVDTFVIVSSDSDFVPLVSKLRASGKTVIGGGRRSTVSRTLVLSCDRYFYLDQQDAVNKDTEVEDSKNNNGESLLVRALKAAMDEHARTRGSKLYQNITRLDPSFDFRGMGYTTFAKYLENSPEVKVTRPSGRGDVTVELSETGEITSENSGWDTDLDGAWSKRAHDSGQRIPGAKAASDAAKILLVGRLSDSKYKTLQGLLDASDFLNSKWDRDRNTIVKM